MSSHACIAGFLFLPDERIISAKRVKTCGVEERNI